MVSTVLTTDSIGSGVRFSFDQTYQLLFLMPGVQVVSTDQSAIFSNFTGSGVVVNGHVATAGVGTSFSDVSAIDLRGAASYLSIGEDATVTSGFTTAGERTVSLSGPGSSVDNSGEIRTVQGIALQLLGTTSTLTNTGLIVGGFRGVVMGNNGEIVNLGTITAGGSFGNVNYALSVGGGTNITNAGVIANIDGDYAAIVYTTDVSGAVIRNTGTISGGATAIATPVSYVDVENYGVILSSFRAMDLSNYGTSVVNRGTIHGIVLLNGGDDIFDGIGGTVNGTVFGGSGDDLFRVSDPLAQIGEAAGQGTDRIESTVSWDLADSPEVENLTLLGAASIDGTGSDVANMITGNRAANTLLGLGGNDTILGQGGADRIGGGTGNDSLDGGTGDDILRGRDGNDRMFGGSEDDQLLGGLGNDRMDGGADDDRLTGGAGADTLIGGAGSDIFIFLSVGNSVPLPTQRDTIADFAPGTDMLDLSAIDASTLAAGNQAFSFIGAAAFGNVAGQLRAYASGPDTWLDGDTNGDGIADLRIVLTGLVAIAATDIVL